MRERRIARTRSDLTTPTEQLPVSVTIVDLIVGGVTLGILIALFAWMGW